MPNENKLTHSKSMILKEKSHKNIDVTFDTSTFSTKSASTRNFLKSSLSRVSQSTVNTKKWLPDLEVLPHVIR
jgi:hypothetical protein